jgi:hypothetical protein
MVEQPRGRDGADQVALASRQHRGQRVAGDVDVRHHIDLPNALPIAVRGLGSAANRDAGVGAQHVDASLRGLDLLDESAHFVFTRNVALDRGDAEFVRNTTRAVAVDVDHDDRARLLRHEASRERATDPTCPTGHDDDPIGQLHRPLKSLLFDQSWDPDCASKNFLVENTGGVLSETCDTA